MNITIPAITLRHLSPTTQKWLLIVKGRDEPRLYIADYEEGFFLRIPAYTACADLEQRGEFAALPVDLQHVFRTFQPLAPYAWILLDVDGDVVPGLALYGE